MNKKIKILTRILCGLLALILTLGLIIPAVTADVITEEPTANVVTEDNNLPDGFKYVVDGYGVQRIEKSDDNSRPAAIIRHVPDNFQIPSITFFVGNMETYEVKYFNVSYTNDYVTSLNLQDGYYVLFANGYSWEAKDGQQYVVNGGQNIYFYVGSSYTNEKYGTNFVTDQKEIIDLNITTTKESFNKISYGASLLVNSDMLKYPDDAKLQDLEQKVEEPTPLPTDPNQPPQEETPSLLQVIWKHFLRVLNQSKFMILILVVCGVCLVVIKLKKRKAQEEQSENDKYDDRRIE